MITKNNKIQILSVRVTQDEYDEILEYSKERNIKISDIIRRSLKENEILKNYYRKTN